MFMKLAIVSLGYVGLPLVVESSINYETIGFDINEARGNELKIWIRSYE